MSDTSTPDELAPPDDFGAEILSQFERREFGTGGAAPAAGDSPVGDWPGGSTSSADHLVQRIDATQVIDSTEEAGSSAKDESAAGEAGEPPAGTAEEPTELVAPADVEHSGPTDDSTAGDSADAQTAESPAPSTEPPSGYVWRDGDQAVEFSDQQVQEALAFAAWGTQLPDETRAAFAGIESGQAVAIPRQEYDQFQAWRAQQDRSTRDADLDRLDVDPDVAKVISDLRDEVAQLRGAPASSPVSTQVGPQGVDPTLDANLTATAQRLDEAAAAYAQDHNLTDAEFQALYTAAINANVIPAIAESMAFKNPVTGAVISPADPGEVIRQALDFALVRNPALHSAVTERAASSTSTSTTPLPGTDAVTAKKARAASVASAPSASVTPPRRDAASLSPQETVAAIQAELAAAMGSA